MTDTSPRNRLLGVAGRFAEIVVGIVFLAFALLKARDVNDFIVAIGNYGVVDDGTLQAAIAIAMLVVETALGVTLILGLRPRPVTLGFTALLLLSFTGLVVYAWVFHGLTDCGCGGQIEMGPKATLLKNAVLLALCGLAWYGTAGAGPGRFAPAKAVGAAMLALVVAGYAYGRVEPPPPPMQAVERPFAQFVFTDDDGLTWDLGQGEHFVAFLNLECTHCRASVADLNRLQGEGAIPFVVGLCDGTESQLEDFRAQTQPEFPTTIIGTRLFNTFIDKAPPQFVLVRDGVALGSWAEELPTTDQLEAARNGSSPEQSAENLVNQGTNE